MPYGHIKGSIIKITASAVPSIARTAYGTHHGMTTPIYVAVDEFHKVNVSWVTLFSANNFVGNSKKLSCYVIIQGNTLKEKITSPPYSKFKKKKKKL